jgi:hypothetical protein
MATRRMILSTIWEDEFVGSLSFFERCLWIGLFSRCADDQGRILDNPVVIRSQIFPYDDIPISDIEAALVKFETVGKVVRYESGGKRLIQLLRWWENQRPQWANRSNYPALPNWIDRIRVQVGREIVVENWVTPAGNVRGELASPLASPVALLVTRTRTETTTTTPDDDDIAAAKDLEATASKHQQQNAVRLALEIHFSTVSALPRPKTDSAKQRTSAADAWYQPLREIAELAEWDEPAAKDLISRAIDRLQERELTISSPRSILKTAQALRAETIRRNGNGHSPPSSSTDHIQPVDIPDTGSLWGIKP